MSKLMTTASAALAALFLLASTAVAQVDLADVPELETDRLVNEGYIQAQIVEMNAEERSLTVRLEETEETAKLMVPEDAEIIRTFPNEITSEIELEALNPGDDILVQATETEGQIRLRIEVAEA